ncbi:MAG: hypothetical protein AAF655_04435 [Bacteroidota bacterium]
MATYGRFRFSPGPDFYDWLGRITHWVGGRYPSSSHHAYLKERSESTHYGLGLEELREKYPELNHSLLSLSFHVSALSGFAVRIHLRFEENQVYPGQGQFVILNARTGEAAGVQKCLFTDIPASELRFTQLFYTHERKSVASFFRVPVQIPFQLLPGTSENQEALFTLHDSFYFNKNINVEEFLNILYSLSSHYLEDSFIHGEVKTSDGDYYFDIPKEELNFLFTHRRYTIIAVWLMGTNSKGMAFQLILHFHTLDDYPNAELEITAKAETVEKVLDYLHHNLSTDPENTLVKPMLLSISPDAATFSLKQVWAFLGEASRTFLHSTPVMASVKTRHGDQLKGLSLYQLKQQPTSVTEEWTELILQIARHSTGQYLILSFDLSDTPTGSLHFRWGDKNIQLAVKKLLWDKLQLA